MVRWLVSKWFKVFTAIPVALVLRAGLFLIFLLVACPVFGQGQQKRSVAEADYLRWGTLYFEKISDKGKWVSYLMDYTDALDTLFLKRSDGSKVMQWAEAQNGSFCGERWFAAQLPQNRLAVTDLDTHETTLLDGVENYVFSNNGRYLITFERGTATTDITIRDTQMWVVIRIEGVLEYRLNQAKDGLVYSQRAGRGTKAGFISLADLGEMPLAESVNRNFSFFVWQDNGKAVAFLDGIANDNDTDNSLMYFVLPTQSLYRLEPSQLPDYGKGKQIGQAHASMLQVSTDGSKVFFGMMDTVQPNDYDDDQIQVWNGNDSWFYPERKMVNDWAAVPKINVWWPKTNKVLPISSNETPKLMLSGDQRYAITFNPAGRGPQYKLEPDADFYLTDLESGVTEPWVINLSSNFQHISIAPNGKCAAYFNAGDWWVYVFSSKEHRNITAGARRRYTGLQFDGTSFFGCAGWGSAGETLLVYDAFDVWAFDVNLKIPAKRLTQGAEAGMVYRVANLSDLPLGQRNFDGRIDACYDTDHLYLKGTAEATQGYFLRNSKGVVCPIAAGNFGIVGLRKAAGAEVYGYIKQRYDVAPGLWVQRLVGRAKQVAQSNEFQQGFEWGSVKLIYFKNSKAKDLKALLYYPAGYDPKLKYPMVVHVYDRQSTQLFNYVNPTLYNEDGFNVSNLTSSGYFVLLPDIDFEPNNVGVSAANCVIAATQAAIDEGLVDANRIGLIGHSFGGYETNFIITQTNLFAAAVSGAGIGDLQAHYLSMAWNLGKPEIFRYEEFPWRMQQSLFEDWERYDRNSPVRFADNIKTPLFLWTGEADRQVHYYNSIGFYLALKRLNKKQMLVVYPNETHSIINPDFQADLTRRVMQWFDYHLKKEKAADWIEKGVE